MQPLEHGRELGPGADRLKPGKADLRRQKSLKGTGRPRQQRVQKGKGQGQGWKGHPDLDEAGGHVSTTKTGLDLVQEGSDKHLSHQDGKRSKVIRSSNSDSAGIWLCRRYTSSNAMTLRRPLLLLLLLLLFIIRLQIVLLWWVC